MIYLNVQGVHHLAHLAEEPDLLITHCYRPVAFSLSLTTTRNISMCVTIDIYVDINVDLT